MATQNTGSIKAYSLNRGGIVNMPPLGITALRNPTANDFAQPFTPWRNIANPAVPVLWFFAGSNAGGAIWQQMEAGSGVGDFSSLVVSPGPTSITGITNINTGLGSGVTNIGVGGTSAVNIGNSTGNVTVPAGNLTVTLGNISTAAGSISSHTTLTAGTGITATTGNITASTGDVVASLGNVTSTAGFVAALTVYSDGDLGGVPATNALTNIVADVAGGGAVTFSAHGAGAITQTGWIKMYAGTAIAYVPYFSAS